ncbi:MAG: hypothetical protein L0221_19075, partial [Chloroflexi bacterium]|nr:hypothetical protein [Chloroflexota bacterium]
MPHAYYPRAGVILDALFEDFGDGSGETKKTIEARPRAVELRRNDHRTADTFRVELDFRDFPLDPRTLRSVRVRVLLGDVEDPAAELPADEDRFRAFVGFVDVPETTLQEGGEVVTLEGRDYTAVFLDFVWSGVNNDGKAIAVNRPLSQVVDDIVATVPGASGVTVVYANGADGLVLADFIGRTKFSAQDGDDAWTVLVDLCGRAGLIPVFVLDELRILDAAAVQAGHDATFLYGENLVSLRYKRKFNEARTRQVKVVCWDEQKRTSREALYPTSPILTKKKVDAEGKVTTEAAPILPFYVAGAFTDQALADLAERIYNEAAREQVEGELESREMRDLDDQVDLPLLGNGDRIRLTLGTSLLANIAGMSESEAIQF